MRVVSDILETKIKANNFIEPGAKVIDALKEMDTVNLSYLIVKEGDKFHGIFSERDYSRNVILKGLHSNEVTVEEVMSKDLPRVTLEHTAEDCMELLNSNKTRYLLVFDAENFKGVVTINDVLREAVAYKESVFDEFAVQEMQDKIY